MWPYTDEEADYLSTGSKFVIKDYLSKHVFDGIRFLSKENADRLRRMKQNKQDIKRG